jgi:hypothetical protein
MAFYLPPLLFGFTFTFFAGFLVKPIVDRLRRAITVPEISDDPELKYWWGELRKQPDISGTVIGIVERIIFFVAFYSSDKSWEAIGVWLAFKVAAKWQAWNIMGYIPDEPDRSTTVQPLRWAYARRMWAAQGYATFVVGTAISIFLAAIGAFVAKNL